MRSSVPQIPIIGKFYSKFLLTALLAWPLDIGKLSSCAHFNTTYYVLYMACRFYLVSRSVFGVKNNQMSPYCCWQGRGEGMYFGTGFNSWRLKDRLTLLEDKQC